MNQKPDTTTRMINKLLEGRDGGAEVTYAFDGYPRNNQKAAPGARIDGGYKNHDDLDTWGGNLVGPMEAVIATLVSWGRPEVTMTMVTLTPREAEELIRESDGE